MNPVAWGASAVFVPSRADPGFATSRILPGRFRAAGPVHRRHLGKGGVESLGERRLREVLGGVSRCRPASLLHLAGPVEELLERLREQLLVRR